MVDNRFPTPGTDARFPSPGTDVRFATLGLDVEQLLDGTDTRFEGATYGAAGVDYVAEMSTLLSGTTGWVTDPADTAINFTDTAGTVPVSSPGVSTVARANTKFGTTVYNWQQATSTAQYLWNSGSWQLDGVDDIIQTTNATWPASMTGCTFTLRFRVDDLSANRSLFSFSTGLGTAARYGLRINTNGSVLLSLRRTDAEAQQDFTSASGQVVTATTYTIQTTVNYLTGAVNVLLNGTSIATGTLTGVDGTNGVDATNSARNRWGLNTSNTLDDWFVGRLGAAVLARSVLGTTDLANCRGFVERNAL